MEDINFQAIVLILAVVISAIRWVGERLKGQGSTGAKSAEREPAEQANSLEGIYEEYRQQIKQRQTAREPAQTTRPSEVPPAYSAKREPHSPPPFSRKELSPPPVKQHKAQLPSQEEPYKVPATFAPVKKEFTAEQQQALLRLQQREQQEKARAKKSKGNLSLRALLSNPASAKQAVILTEILGKPKSAQSDPFGYS